MNLRPYQVSGKAQIYNEWDFSDVLFYVLATGGGKTVQFIDIIKDFLFQGKRVMLIAHREELIMQAYNKLYENYIISGIIKGDIKTNYDLPCQVCSIQTIQRRKFLPPADLLIIDEAHHVTESNGYGSVLARYPDAKVLLVSATPYRLSGESFETVLKGKITRLIVNSDLRSLIEDGWLCPIDYYIPDVPELQDIEMSKGDYKEESARKVMEMAPVVEAYQEHAAGEQGITFAVDVKHSSQMKGKFNNAGIPTEHVDADTPDEDYTDKNGEKQRGRRTIISDFNCGLVKNVTNVGIFTEGTDFPNCQFVIDAAPTKSLSKKLQKDGRATRPLKSLNIDSFLTAQERKDAIANSAKPYAKILDCCGAFVDHGLPDKKRDWEHYFFGRHKGKGKKAKEEAAESMIIEIFEAERPDGSTFRTTKAKEVAGLKLIRITQDIQRKSINIKCIKEFDRLHGIMRNKKNKGAGAAALYAFIDYCERNQYFMYPEVWDYLTNKLSVQPERDKFELLKNAREYPQTYTQPIVAATMKRLEDNLVKNSLITKLRVSYFEKNSVQLNEYLLSKTLV